MAYDILTGRRGQIHKKMNTFLTANFPEGFPSKFGLKGTQNRPGYRFLIEKHTKNRRVDFLKLRGGGDIFEKKKMLMKK